MTHGTLLRTKAVGVNEGGVAAGFSVIDSVCPQDIDPRQEIKPLVNI